MADVFSGGKQSGPTEAEVKELHAAFGTVLAILFLARIVLRWKHGASALPADMPVWQKTLARFVQWALYLLIGGVIVSGILTAMNANSMIMPFGLFAYGDGTAAEADFLFLRQFHEFATKAIMVLIGLHIAGALFHLLIKRDGVTGRMLRFWKRP